MRYLVNFYVVALLFSGVFPPAQATEYSKSIIVVVDDSTFVFKDTPKKRGVLAKFLLGENKRTAYRKAKQYLPLYLNRKYPADTHVTFVSVFEPQVVWEGDLSRAFYKENGDVNPAVTDLLFRIKNGCAFHELVAKKLTRIARSLPRDVDEVIYLSSLVQASREVRKEGEACGFDQSSLDPPDDFFDKMVSLNEKYKASFSFFWIHTHLDDLFETHFYEQDVPFRTYSVDQTKALFQ